jgi:diguanylate cyclase (GGDEF)-like protein
MPHAKAASRLSRLQNEILEAIACGEALSAVTERLCLRVQELTPSAICSVLNVDAEGRLHPLAGPSLPQAYSEALDGLSIGPCCGSCGTAAHRGEPVIVTDIATDPLWGPYKELALPLGLRACWSSPIKARDGRVVGTFAFYYADCRGPSELELAIVQTCLHLCAIAIEHAEVQSRAHRLAYFDTLTGLANRAQFSAAFETLVTGEAPQFGLLLIDIDQLKLTNDTMGHAVGDALIEAVGQRLRELEIGGLPCRIGGDEFAILLAGCSEAAALREAAGEVLGAMSAPFQHDGHTIAPKVTIGGVLYGEDGRDAVTLRQNADFALYHAKEQKRGGYVRFKNGLRTSIMQRVQIVRRVDEALCDERITPYYQPVVQLDTAEIIGLEALARMRSGDGRIVTAGEFHEALTDPKVAYRLTNQMIAAVAADMRAWLDAGCHFRQVGLNVTSADFQRGDLAARIVKAFEKVEVPLRHLVVEVTESVFLAERNQSVARNVRELRNRGALVALDDFGTGYASLTHLLQFPVDVIKVDRSFVEKVQSDRQSSAIVEALILIADRLGMKIIAEGIETSVQAEHVLAMGCRLGQGYHYSKPVPRQVASDLLRRFGQRPGSRRIVSGLPFEASAA